MRIYTGCAAILSASITECALVTKRVPSMKARTQQSWHTRLANRLSLLLLCCAPACSGSELVGVHLKLEKNGSGTITARALQASTQQGPAEAKISGVRWQLRASLISSQGTFEKVDGLTFGNGELRFVLTQEEAPHLRVILQRHPELAWVKTLVPDPATRRSLVRVHDPKGKQLEIGDIIRLEIELPGDVTAAGCYPAARNVEALRERNTAQLILPVTALLESGDDLIWDISWR
ncbi:MAG: hypothetical protein WCR59_12295 [Planctomycetota bacterium]